MEKPLKIYFKLGDSINESLVTSGLSLDFLLEGENIEIKKEEVTFNDDPSTRGIVTYVILRLAEPLLKDLALWLGEKVLDKVVDTGLERILKPILDFIKVKEPKKEITVNIYVLDDKDGKSLKTLNPGELSQSQIDSLDKILLDIKATEK